MAINKKKVLVLLAGIIAVFAATLFMPPLAFACVSDAECVPDIEFCYFPPDEPEGYCKSICSPNEGTSCSPANACGATNTGTIQCDGSCSVSAPSDPAGLGDSCDSPANSCGDTTTGTLVCDGTTGTKCNEIYPPDERDGFGDPCTKSNACDSNSGTIQCDGSCSAADPDPLPSGYGNSCNCNNINQCGGTINCSGSCSGSQPADATVSFSASLSSPVSNGTSVMYTATTNTSIASPYSINIYDFGSGTLLKTCTGTSCSTSVSDSNTARTFKAIIENGAGIPVVTSSNVSTTWKDTTTPAVSIDSPVAGTWQKVSFTVSASGTDETGGSGLSLCSFAVFDNGTSPAAQTGTFACSGTSFSTTFTVTGCSTDAADKCLVTVYAKDTAGNQTTSSKLYSYDNTAPAVGAISPDNALYYSPTTFQAAVSDTTSGISSCDFLANGGSLGAMTVSGTTASFTHTFKQAGTFNLQVSCKDKAGNSKAGSPVSLVIPQLTYPSTTWQRLWYKAYGSSPSVYFDASGFLDEGPNEPSLNFINSWGAGTVLPQNTAHNIPTGYTDKVGFISTRTITIPSAGNYSFTIGSDDGSRLYIDGTEVLNQWNDQSYAKKTVILPLTVGDHQVRLDFYENIGDASFSFEYSLACSKTPTLSADDYSLAVPGGEICSISIVSLGADNSDGLGIAMESLSHPANANYIGMDDNTASGCENNLKFHNTWDTTTGSYNFAASSTLDAYSVGNALGYGFQLSTSCAVKDFAGVCAGAGNYCPTGAKLDEQTFKVVGQKSSSGSTAINAGGLQNNLTTDGFAFQFNIVECTQNSHCTAAGKTTCNLGQTTNFPQNTCIDSVAPTITIGEIRRTSPDPKVITNNWLKAGIYEISVTVQDNVGGSSVDTAYGPVTIRSRGKDDTFDTPDDKKYPTDWIGDNKFSVWVGPDDDPTHPFNNPLNDCVNEEKERCRVEVYARDLAGNTPDLLDSIILLNIDYTAPSAK